MRRMLMHDLRSAMRPPGRIAVSLHLPRRPLALGIGATTTLFTLVDGLFLRSPVRDAGRLVDVQQTIERLGILKRVATRRRPAVFDAVRAWAAICSPELVASGGAGTAPSSPSTASKRRAAASNAYRVTTSPSSASPPALGRVPQAGDDAGSLSSATPGGAHDSTARPRRSAGR